MKTELLRLPLPDPGKDNPYLENFGFESPSWVHRIPIWPLAVLVLVLAVAWGFFSRSRDLNVTGSDIVVTGTLLIGLWQWRVARHEISMDKYYDRLGIANKRQEGEKTPVRNMMRPTAPELSQEHSEILMYVYTELDNLEYVIEKYRLGYMDAEQACRGLRTFQLRCWSPQFRCIAHHRVHAGDYNPRTARVVDKVHEAIGRLTALEYTGSGSAAGAQTPGRGLEAPTGPQPQRRRASDGSHLSAVPHPNAESTAAAASPPPTGPERPPSAVGENR